MLCPSPSVARSRYLLSKSSVCLEAFGVDLKPTLLDFRVPLGGSALSTLKVIKFYLRASFSKASIRGEILQSQLL